MYIFKFRPVVTVANGVWSKPYFDCQGGNIWMTTFSAPILGGNGGDILEFKFVNFN